MTIRLDLSRHCIETEIRRRRNRAVSAYFKKGGNDPALEREIELFDEALQGLDFPHLRGRHPALAGGTKSRVEIGLDPSGRVNIFIDGSPVDTPS